MTRKRLFADMPIAKTRPVHDGTRTSCIAVGLSAARRRGRVPPANRHHALVHHVTWARGSTPIAFIMFPTAVFGTDKTGHFFFRMSRAHLLRDSPDGTTTWTLYVARRGDKSEFVSATRAARRDSTAIGEISTLTPTRGPLFFGMQRGAREYLSFATRGDVCALWGGEPSSGRNQFVTSRLLSPFFHETDEGNELVSDRVPPRCGSINERIRIVGGDLGSPDCFHGPADRYLGCASTQHG